MQQEIERMEHEMRQQKLQNEMLSQNLNRLRSVLASSFGQFHNIPNFFANCSLTTKLSFNLTASLPLPGTHEPPNIHTIDKYMNEVKAMQEVRVQSFRTHDYLWSNMKNFLFKPLFIFSGKFSSFCSIPESREGYHQSP